MCVEPARDVDGEVGDEPVRSVVDVRLVDESIVMESETGMESG